MMYVEKIILLVLVSFDISLHLCLSWKAGSQRKSWTQERNENLSSSLEVCLSNRVETVRDPFSSQIHFLIGQIHFSIGQIHFAVKTDAFEDLSSSPDVCLNNRVETVKDPLYSFN